MAKVRKKEDGILPGQVTSVLTQEFVVATNTEGFDQTRVKQAFTARKLPSSEEILKLFQHLRQVAGPKNSSVKDSDLFQIILSILKFYWEMAAFPTLTDTNIRLKEWEDLDTSSEAEIQILDLPASEREALIVFFQEIYTNGDKVLLRHDYKELVEICLKLLGAELPAEKVFSWKKVGAVHKARFMAWSLCSLKAFAFSSNMDFSEETKENLRRITLFQITIYIPHFLMSSIGSDAAFNDLSLHKKLQKFQDIDEVIGGEALKTLERHLWYLSDLTIPMALFSEKVDPDIKARLAARILAMKNNKKKAQKLGKPKFPKIGRTTELYDLVTEDSWEFFSIIKVDDNWLEQPVGSWEDSEDYRTARNFVHNVKTTNDLAERAIKTATDYSQILTKDEETRRRIIQGVEDHRRTYPDFRKSILNK